MNIYCKVMVEQRTVQSTFLDQGNISSLVTYHERSYKSILQSLTPTVVYRLNMNISVLSLSLLTA